MMNSFLKLSLFALVIGLVRAEDPEVKVEEDVLVLTEKNFDHVVTNNQHVLVEFYAPWCGHCKALAPEYAKAAATLKEDLPDVKLAKVDATAEKQLGTKYEVRGYPTLKFFVDGKPREYQGSPNSEESLILVKEWEKSAKTLKAFSSEMKMAKVDCSKEKAVAKVFRIDEEICPIALFFRNHGNRTLTYTGGRQADDIVNWLKKKTGPPCKVLNNEDDVTAFKEKNEVAVIGYFSSADTAEAKNYDLVANQIDDVPFGVTFDAAAAKSSDINLNSVVVFKKFDEGRADYEGELSDDEALTNFIKGNQLRLLTEFTSEKVLESKNDVLFILVNDLQDKRRQGNWLSAPKIFGGEIQVHNLLFVSKKSDNFQTLHDDFRDAAKEFKGKVLFIYIDSDVEDNKRVMEFFGLSDSDVPDYRIIKMSENMAKYKPETKDLSKDAVIQFTREVESGAAKRHLMSQEIPEDWDKNPVAVLVGKNFKEVAFDQSKKVFVEFYAPWCGHCKALKPTWEKLGEAFQDDKDVVIAMMDSTANEVSDFEISGFPTLKFFPSGSDQILDYNGDRTEAAMIEYVKSNGEKVSGGEDEDEGEEIDEEDMDEEYEDDELPEDEDEPAARDEL